MVKKERILRQAIQYLNSSNSTNDDINHIKVRLERVIISTIDALHDDVTFRMSYTIYCTP